MKLETILTIANRSYPDDMIDKYAKNPHRNHGDTLALFIVREITDTYEMGAPDKEQLAQARKCLGMALREMGRVEKALEEAEENL
jgi:hypothetical protein